MKAFKLGLILVLTLAFSSRAQEARYFRMVGPVPTTITSFTADGYMTWTNELTNATFTVQTATSLVGASNWVDYVQIPTTNGVSINRLFDPSPPTSMALIPAGSFTMGDAFFGEVSGEEIPLHSVYVSAYYMDRYEVTKVLWDEVYNWATNNGYNFEYGAEGKAANHPVQTVTWYDCVKWCNARSEKEGRVPAYYVDAGNTVVYRTGTNDLSANMVNWGGGYRLPTEAEWEKAARGGASGHRFSWSDVDTITHSQANYNSTPSTDETYDVSPTHGHHPTFDDGVPPYTSPVGYFAPNGYGLYDITGNVREWCWDWWGGAYTSDSQTDPRGPVGTHGSDGVYRMLRGGSWDARALIDRCAFRNNLWYPNSRSYNVGFRCVLVVAAVP